MMGNLDAKSPVPNLMADVHFLPFPSKHRNIFGIVGEAGEVAVLRYIENMLDDVESGVQVSSIRVDRINIKFLYHHSLIVIYFFL
jgi:hypothetical protein